MLVSGHHYRTRLAAVTAVHVLVLHLLSAVAQLVEKIRQQNCFLETIDRAADSTEQPICRRTEFAKHHSSAGDNAETMSRRDKNKKARLGFGYILIASKDVALRNRPLSPNLLLASVSVGYRRVWPPILET